MLGHNPERATMIMPAKEGVADGYDALSDSYDGCINIRPDRDSSEEDERHRRERNKDWKYVGKRVAKP